MMGVGDDGVAAGHDAWQLARAVAEELVDEGALDRAYRNFHLARRAKLFAV
jgi:hypothetical protein